MSKIANLYANAVKNNFKVLFANWEPGGPIELGDYGILSDNIFIPVGKLKNDFEEFKGDVIQITLDPTQDHKEFKSEKGVEVNLVAKGAFNPQGVQLAKASIEIKFSSEDSIFFNAAGCSTSRIANKAKIGQIIKELKKQDKWEKKWCVVTDLVHAGKTLIAISQSSNSGLTLEADSPALEKINLADASIKLSPSFERSIGYKVVADEGLNLLIGLCKLKNPFIIGPSQFKPRTMRMTASMEYNVENDNHIKTEESGDELIFGQLGKE